MAKEKVKKVTGVLAAVFAHTGHISKEEALEISGLDKSGFEEVYAKAAVIASKMTSSKGMDTFLTHFGKAIDEFVKDIDPGFLA